MHLVIFDVDGTLVDSNVVEGEAFSAAVQQYYGIEEFNTDWSDYKYSTDSGILGEIVEAHLGRLPTPVEVAEIQDRFVENLSALTIWPIAGAKGMIGELRLALQARPRGRLKGVFGHDASPPRPAGF
jgi:beta-phosphoglucomutase-like phosphatase (HAD superfamily)